MPVTSDADLLTACRADDREAYAVLLARHHGLVHSACLRQAPPGEAEDCVQAVFLVLMRRPAAAARAPVLAAWLLRVAWYVCRAAQRAARCRRTAEQQAASLNVMPDSTRPEALDHLDDCLARLPERQRAAISLQYLAGKPAEDVASELGVSRDNAYQLVSRGLVTLRGLLARRGVAITAPALGLLLADQAQAAVSTAVTTASITAALGTTPSASVAALTTGAINAMTIATIAPFAAVAGLLLPLSAATVMLAADPVPPPVKPQVPAATTATTRDIRAILEQEITLDFQQTDYSDVMAFLQRVTTVNIVVLPEVSQRPPGPITLRVQRMRLSSVLDQVDRLAGTAHEVRNDSIVVSLVPPMVDLSRLEGPGRQQLWQQPFACRLEKLTPLEAFTRIHEAVGIQMTTTPAFQARCADGVHRAVNLTTELTSGYSFQDVTRTLCEMTHSTLSSTKNATILDVSPVPENVRIIYSGGSLFSREGTPGF